MTNRLLGKSPDKAATSEGPLRVNVVGLGYVGAEVCLAANAAGYQVTAIDKNSAWLESLKLPVSDQPYDDWADIRALIMKGKISVHDSAANAPTANVWIVAVPTLLDTHGRPDVSSISEAAQAVSSVVARDTIVILESTSYPGTTDEIFLPPFRNAGWTPGVDIFIGYSPERINPGSGEWVMKLIPKLVSGCTTACLAAVSGFYQTVVDVVYPMSSTRAAEMAKLCENSWRLVNIAFADEIESLCVSLGINAWEIGEACRTKPFGYAGLDPGPGAGGRCIPVAAGYLRESARSHGQQAAILEAAVLSNQRRPFVIVDRILDQLAEAGAQVRSPRRVLLIGVTYKSNVADVRGSPALSIMERLDHLGIEVHFHDPHVTSVSLANGPLTSVPLTRAAVTTYDCIAVLTAHDAVDWTVLKDCGRPIIDIRNVLATPDACSF